MTFNEISPADWAKLLTAITSITSTLAGILAYLIRSGQNKTHAGLAEIKINMNGRMDELLILTRAAAHAAGMKDQRDETSAALAASKKPPSDAPDSA